LSRHCGSNGWSLHDQDGDRLSILFQRSFSRGCLRTVAVESFRRLSTASVLKCEGNDDPRLSTLLPIRRRRRHQEALTRCWPQQLNNGHRTIRPPTLGGVSSCCRQLVKLGSMSPRGVQRLGSRNLLTVTTTLDRSAAASDSSPRVQAGIFIPGIRPTQGLSCASADFRRSTGPRR
jgi:hypothetical protein